MESHTKPIIQQHVEIEALPSAMKSVTQSLQRVEKNLNRLDRLMGRVLEHVENQFDDEEEVVNMRDVETVFKGHREIRDTLLELAKWMEKAESIDDKQSVSVMQTIQEYFMENSPQQWAELKGRLVAAGAMS